MGVASAAMQRDQDSIAYFRLKQFTVHADDPFYFKTNNPEGNCI